VPSAVEAVDHAVVIAPGAGYAAGAASPAQAAGTGPAPTKWLVTIRCAQPCLAWA